MEKNSGKKILLFLLPELGCMALAASEIFGLSYFGILEQAADKMLCHIVLVVLGIGVVGFSMRMHMIRGKLDYDNGRHILRFWLCFAAGSIAAVLCVFLPAAAWPFLPVFVLLTLFSNLHAGTLAGAVLLAVPVCLTGGGAEIYLMYVISGLLGAVLFQDLQSGFKTPVPLGISLGCLLVCLTAATVLTANARPGLEYFVVPAANLIVSGLLLFGILKYFFAKSIYYYRNNYLELNDTENSMLSEWKKTDKNAYLKSVHTAYFCERIAVKLGLGADALKCAGYYHGMEKLPEPDGKCTFPPEVLRILEDYRKGGRGICFKETAVLTASDDVISAVLSLIGGRGDKAVDYDREIDAIFRGYYEKGFFDQCDISVKELKIMERTFKEEKLYYDFLR